MKQQLPQNLTLRHPALEDAQAVLDLMVACDIEEYGEPDSSLEDLLDEWSDIDLEQDAWLVYSPEGQLVGYAVVSGDTRLFFGFFTRPVPERVDLNGFLLAACETRAHARLAGHPAAGSAVAITIIPHVNQAGTQAAEAAGFAPHHYHFRMQIDLDAPPPDPAWPQGVTLRTILPGQDDQQVYDFIQAAFERPGRVPPTFEQWRGFMMRPDHFVPDLWFLVFHGEELVGASLCFDYPQHGWVRQLGVAAGWRKQGLGAALLQHTFAVFYRRGHRQVALGVDSENLRAVHFYEGVGMQCVRQYNEYHKILGEG